MLAGFGRSWFLWLIVISGIWVGLPWLAPLFMRFGWEAPASWVYFLYSFQCHQLPERSLFLFGSKLMYSLEEIRAVWPAGSDPLILRQFIGTPEMGYKVAWSDRMISAYTSLPVAAVVWRALRRWLPPLPWWGLMLLMLPMAFDGGTHFLSDLAGIEQGFRYENLWLARLTAGRFSEAFYAGNAIGSFNSWMRWITGILFGAGVSWFVLASFMSTVPKGEQFETHPADRRGETAVT